MAGDEPILFVPKSLADGARIPTRRQSLVSFSVHSGYPQTIIIEVKPGRRLRLHCPGIAHATSSHLVLCCASADSTAAERRQRYCSLFLTATIHYHEWERATGTPGIAWAAASSPTCIVQSPPIRLPIC